MYKIVPVKKTTAKGMHDYMFKDFSSFYKVADVITVPLKGQYSIGITTEDADAVREFLKSADRYGHLMISIYMPESVVEHMSLYNTRLNVAERVKPFDIMVKLVSGRQLLLDKGVIYTLYNTVGHSEEEMTNAVELLYRKYGPQNKISENMLAEDFVINKITYPRSVLLAYLWLDRWRKTKLKKCIADVGNDVALASCIKRIKELQAGKADYFRTGCASNLIKSLDTFRITLMYRVLVTDRENMRDLTLLMEMYERGLTPDDYIQRKSY